MAKQYDGSVLQSSQDFKDMDYDHEKIFYPVLGIVTDVYLSDSEDNRSAYDKPDQRGSCIQANVLCTLDDTDNYNTLTNVTVLPPGPTGILNFSEAIPRPCSTMIDGSAFRPDLAGIDYEKLDGDWCVVQFVGGNVSQPIMTHWFPHPGNRVDPATSGSVAGLEEHGPRYLKKINGVRFEVDKDGNLLFDTNEANSAYQFAKKSLKRARQSREGGGSVQVDIKNGAQLELNFNTKRDIENPPIAEERPTTDTRVTMTKDTVTIRPGTAFYLGEETADEPVVLGNKLVELLETMINILLTHKHSTALGPSGEILPPEQLQLTTEVKNKLAEFLSAFAFTQKTIT